VHQRLSVTFEYPVVFTRDLLAQGNPVLTHVLTSRGGPRPHRILAVLDDGVASAFPDLSARLAAYAGASEGVLALASDPVVVPGGERAKNDPTIVARLHREIHARHVDRHSFVVVVGGGGVLDAAGYAAATAHRGIRLVRVPTTVLGQNDSGVGVKNGINAFEAKNFLGTFAPPFAVLNDSLFLERLPRRDRIAGLAEAVKVALIRDGSFFTWLEAHVQALAACDLDTTTTAIRRCAELHLAHIAGGGDPFETGSARPLDFGHWAAHKLESLTTHELRHGEAVALGLLIDGRYSVEAGLLDAASFGRLHALLGALGLPRWHTALEDHAPLLGGLEDFREHLGGELTVTLLTGLGRAVEVHAMDVDRIRAAIAWLGEARAR
jgi:3-dehydroquinate synthase